MGAYVYRLLPPSLAFTAHINGKPERVGCLAFAYKPYRMGGDADRENRRMHRQYATIPSAAAWRGKDMPRYVVVVHGTAEMRPGEPVTLLRWRQGRLTIVDDPDWSGCWLGMLRLVGQDRNNPASYEATIPEKEPA